MAILATTHANENPDRSWHCLAGFCDGCQASGCHDPEFTPPCLVADEPPDGGDFEPAFEPTADDWREAEQVRDEMAAERCLGDDEGLTLVQLIERNAAWYAGWGTEAGDLLAETLSELAAAVAFTKAASVAEYKDRLAILQGD
jgi:hypothetical protein